MTGGISFQSGISIGGGPGFSLRGYSNPVCRTPMTTSAGFISEVAFCCSSREQKSAHVSFTTDDLRIATLDGEAMCFSVSGRDLSGYVGKRLVFRDTAGKVARCYASAAGGGEELGSELITNGNFSSWTGDNPNNWGLYGPEDANNYVTETSGKCRIVSNGGSIGITQAVSLPSGSLFKRVVDVSAISGLGFRIIEQNGGVVLITNYTTTGMKSLYRTATTETVVNISRKEGGASDSTIDDLSYKRLTNVPTTGLLLVSTLGGSTRNMTSVESGFNPNAVSEMMVFDSELEVTNGLKAQLNVTAGTLALIKVLNGVRTTLASTAVPVMNKNYAPTACCTDPDNDQDVTTGWTTSNGAVLTSEDNGRTGNCARVTIGAASTTPQIQKNIAVKPGETFNLKYYVKAGTEATYGHNFYDSTNGAFFGASGDKEETAGDWSTVQNVNITIPERCISLTYLIYQKGVAGSGTYIDFDDVTFQKTSTDDIVTVVDRTSATSSDVYLFHDGAQVGSKQTITDTAIITGKNHFLGGSYGASELYKRRFALGQELVVNGGFDSDLSQWTLGNTGITTVWEWSAGTAKVVTTAGTKWRNIQKLALLTVGKYYRITLIGAGVSAAGDLVLYVDTPGKYIGANGAISTVSAALNTNLIFYSTKVDLSIDDVSCKEVLLP